MGIRAERMTRMATIEIKMLGGFEIRVNGKPVLAQLAQSRKATALVQYLVLRRGERVSHKVLTDTLWAGERSTNPDMALRAILHRFRLMIDAEGLDEMKGCIVTSRGYYQWNPHLDCSVDVFEVNDLSELARKESDAEKRSRIYEQIVNLYDGRLLPQSASEPWVESVSVRLHGQYRTAILNLLELCKKWGESTRIVTLCTRALELDPYEERLYLEKIVALETLGRHEEAEDLARRGSAMGCLHHAIEPGRAGSAYRQMRQADRNMESEVSKLISALPDTEDTGACICDFETFKEIYRVQRGVQVRYGLQVFLAILTVAPSQNTDAAETALMVEQLGDLIRTNLRQCDVGARYTDMQYVVMLSGSTAESGTGPLERIKAAFYWWPSPSRCSAFISGVGGKRSCTTATRTRCCWWRTPSVWASFLPTARPSPYRRDTAPTGFWCCFWVPSPAWAAACCGTSAAWSGPTSSPSTYTPARRWWGRRCAALCGRWAWDLRCWRAAA